MFFVKISSVMLKVLQARRRDWMVNLMHICATIHCETAKMTLMHIFKQGFCISLQIYKILGCRVITYIMNG
jgi:hypothetical protein